MIKRNLFRLMALMMVTTLCMGFTACGDDDDEGNDSPIVATWTNSSNDNQQYQFKSNGDVVNHVVNPKFKGVTDQELSDSEVEKYVYGTYSLNGNRFTITWTKEKTLVVKSDNSQVWEEKTYSAPKVDAGTFTITEDLGTYFLTLNIEEGDGISSTWSGWSD